MGAHLVGALGEERYQHHEIGQSEEPIIGFASGFGGAGDEAEMARLGELVNVLDADASQAGNFRIGEDFLARFDRDHGLAPGPPTLLLLSALRLCFFSALLPTTLEPESRFKVPSAFPLLLRC